MTLGSRAKAMAGSGARSRSTTAASDAIAGVAPRNLVAVLSGIGLTALLVYLALTPLPPFASDVFGSLVRRHLVLGGVLLGYAGWLAAGRRLPRRSAFDLALAAVTAAALLAVWRSADQRVSIEAVLSLLPALVLFYVLHDLKALDQRWLAAAAVAAAAVVAVFALASVWRSWNDWLGLVRAVEGGVGRDTLLPPSTPRVADVGNHPNILGCLFAMALPAAALAAATSRSRWARALIAACAVLTLLALFFTLSRAAWVGAATGSAVTALGFAAAAPGRLKLSRRVVVVALAVSAVAAMVVVGLLARDVRPDWLFRDSLGPRADQRRAGLEMFQDHPLTGAGPGMFAALYPQYGGAYPFAAVHTHNVVVQTAADTGLFGLAAGGFLVASVAFVAAEAYRRGSPAQRRSVAAALGMLTVFAVHSLADSPQLFPETTLLAVVALVILCRAGGDAFEAPSWLPTPVALLPAIRTGSRTVGLAGPALAVVLAVSLPVAWLITDRGHAAYARSVDAAKDEDWPAAIAAGRQAVERDGSLAANWFQLGAAHAFAAIDGDRRAEQQMALGALQRGLEREPHNGAALVNYAALNVVLDRPEAARETLPALARLAGRDSLLLLAHATITQWTAPPEEAIETYAGLLVLNPSLAGTPFWQDNGFRTANFRRIVERALQRVPEVAGEGPAADALRAAILVYSGETPSAESLEAALGARPDDVALRVALGRLLTAEPGRGAEAFELLAGAVRLKGDDASARAALGDWYATAGDVPAARREWTAASFLGDLASTVALGNSFPAGQVPSTVKKRAESQLAGEEIARFYFIFQTYRFTFQREEAVPIILPGDWLTALPDALPRWRADVERW